MVTRAPNQEDVSIHSSNFGGLNIYAAPVNVEPSDALRALNVDTSVSGRLGRRRGSDAVYSMGAATNVNLHKVQLGSGLELLVSVFDGGFEISYFNSTITRLFDFNNVFKFTNTEVSFTTIPGDTIRVVAFSAVECPKQVSFHELILPVTSAGTSVVFDADAPINNQTVCNSCKVFVNDILDSSATLSYSFGTVTITLSSAAAVGDVVTVLYCTWQWWAESKLWRGLDFQQTVPRFGANEADKIVAVPPEFLVDGYDEDPYGVYAYSVPDSTYIQEPFPGDQYVLTATPTRDYQYKWSSGVPKVSNVAVFDATANPESPFFIEFGRESSVVEYDLLYTDFNLSSAGSIRIPGHEFVDGDYVELVQSNANLSGKTTTNHYVKVESANWIRLYAEPTFVTASTIVHQNVAMDVASGSVNAATDTFTVSSSTAFTDKAMALALGNTLAGGLTQGREYFVTAPSGTTVQLAFDERKASIVDITAAAATRLVTLHPIKLRRVLYNTVSFLRVRPITFNGNDGVTGNNSNLLINGGSGNFGLDTGINNRGTSDYFHLTDPDNLNSEADATTLGQHLLVSAYLKPNDWVSHVNVETKWCGSSAQSSWFVPGNTATHLGGYVLTHGYGEYADYKTGSFNAVGVMHQERLVLAGFRNKPSTILASSIGDRGLDNLEGYFYDYFQITDSMQGLADEPFDVVLGSNSPITALLSWQQHLFVFTENEVFRTYSIESPFSPTNRAFLVMANKGITGKNACIATGNNIYYISPTGVYAVPVVLQGEYRLEEISQKIRPVFSNYRFKHLSFDSFSDKLYITSEDNKAYVFDLLSGSWSESSSTLGFISHRMVSLRDYSRREERLLRYVNSSWYIGLIASDSTYQADAVKTVPVSSSPITVTPAQIIFETIPAVTNVTIYRHSVYTNIFGTFPNDYEIWYGISRAASSKLTDVEVTKLPDNQFSTTSAFSPTTGANFYIVPKPAGTLYGLCLYLDDIPIYVTDDMYDSFVFDDTVTNWTLDMASMCFTALEVGNLSKDLLTIGTGDCLFNKTPSQAKIGYSYPSEFMCPAMTREMLAVTKRVEHVYTWFAQRKRTDALNYFGDIPRSLPLTSKQVYPTVVNVAIIANTDRNVASELTLLSQDKSNSTDEWSLFKLALQRLGYVYRLYVQSNDPYDWELNSYQVIAKAMSNTGFISGGV